MSRLSAYDPQHGYRFQILCRNGSGGFEHCDYAEDREERTRLIREYRLAYGPGWEFRTIELPRKYWPAKVVQ